MKVSKLSVQNIKDYIRIDTDDEDTFIESLLIGAKAYIRSYTGLDDKQMDEKEDLSMVVLVLCSELYDNRQYTVDKNNINPIIQSILDMHSINLL